MTETKKSFTKLRKKYKQYRNNVFVMQQLESSFARFFRREASGGIMLLIFTALALLFANVPALNFMEQIWYEKIQINFGSSAFDFKLQTFVNDGLMAVFFFVVGLEIKRELMVGELSNIKQATLPIAAAMGGMLLPACIFMLCNSGGSVEEMRGWGVPMATDIAFAVGILAMMGKLVPLSLKIFLIALSIVDDLGAIIVIALFYPSHDLHVNMMMYACIVLIFLIICNYSRVKSPIAYILAGFLLWFFVLQSGIHATIAGVLLAITIPSTSDINQIRFYVRGKYLLNKFKVAYGEKLHFMANKQSQEIVEAMSSGIESIRPMSIQLEKSLHPFVMFVIMPVFALANAGVAFDAEVLSQLNSPVSIGIFLGLVVGKPLGILLLSYIAVRFHIAQLPPNVNWKQICAIATIAGIGFTMSLFINGLAFSSDEIVNLGKMSILFASIIAGVIGWILCKLTMPRPE